jgi:hypothetical protein
MDTNSTKEAHEERHPFYGSEETNMEGDLSEAMEEEVICDGRLFLLANSTSTGG